MGPNPTLSHAVNRTAKDNNTTLKMSMFFDNFTIQILQKYLKKNDFKRKHVYTLKYTPYIKYCNKIRRKTRKIGIRHLFLLQIT